MQALEQDLLYSAIPGVMDAADLRHHYQRKLLQSLKIFFSGLAQTAKIDLHPQIERLDNLDFTRRLSPFLYALYVQVKEAYEKRALEALFDCVQLLNNEPQQSLYADQLVVGTLLSEAWERPFVAEIRESLPLDQHDPATSSVLKALPLIHCTAADFPPEELLQALHVLKEIDSQMYREGETYVSRIKLFSSRSLHSVTSPRYFGAVYLRLPLPSENEILFYLETLVHEVSHLHLFTIMDRDPLLLAGAEDLFASPLRADKRPMLGVFHAVFVLARMLRILRRFCNAGLSSGNLIELVQKREIGFREGLQTVTAHAQLSGRGKELVASLEPCAFE